MPISKVSFSIVGHAAWAPGLETREAWVSWGKAPFTISGNAEPALKQMPSMLRRRAGPLSRMALEVAYECLDGRKDIPVIFCSRHGDVARAMRLIGDLVRNEPLSPTDFGLAVHNASAGLFSIARGDHANHLAVAAGTSTVEHGVIEACGLLADGAPLVLLVSYDNPLPSVLSRFEDCKEQPHAWAWLMAPSMGPSIHLSWDSVDQEIFEPEAMPGSLQIWNFYIGGMQSIEHKADYRQWHWKRDNA